MPLNSWFIWRFSATNSADLDLGSVGRAIGKGQKHGGIACKSRSFARAHCLNLIACRAVLAACFGFFVDMFEVYLPIAVLVPALAYFIPAGLSGAAQATIFYIVFAVSLIGRPLGAVVFGHFGDRLGRRRTTLISVTGFGIATLLIAALPGFAAWGEAAIAALIILRLLNGIFIGGEYTAANPLAMEYSPKDKRGLYAACIHVGYAAALVCASLLTALMLEGGARRRRQLGIRGLGLANPVRDWSAARRRSLRLLLFSGP